MNGFSIDPGAVSWHAGSFWSYSGLVVRHSWSGVEDCLAEEVESSMAQLREWFLSSWSSIGWELAELADGTAGAATVLGSADDAAAAAASSATSSLGAGTIALSLTPATQGAGDGVA